ncbi:MAG: FAD-dependent oxidoreductase [Dehalococcoidia bacterium]|jgi:fumarate reductase flavoprotein subunit|nr:FAD-dependent oxidoreductase [Dehalococcoidia bacterium]MDP7512007.1 FAD-dependent oxidoreductase [Dehalococcoidia bacterium]HJN85615.1 FAD-dependent oxidoreductase [Dehalococcoidia bacterium]
MGRAGWLQHATRLDNPGVVEMAEFQADVVVVGGGGAGLAAAVEAAAAGGRVILIEKNPSLGGSTALSVGSVSACCTSLQRREGIEDSFDAFFEDIGLFNDLVGLNERDNLEFRRLLVQKSPATFQWLMELGVSFFGPMPEPPNRVPRMHNALPNSSAYIYNLRREAKKRGVEIRLGVSGERILLRNGRVTGVEANTARGEKVSILASGGLVLASGDFSSGAAMKERYLPPNVAHIEGINPTSTGDGQRMALEVGAKVVNGDLLMGPGIRFVAPRHRSRVSRLPPARPLTRLMSMVLNRLPAYFLRPLIRPFVMSFITTHLAPSPELLEEGAIYVNREGRRFTNELDQPALAIPRQPEQEAFILFDAAVARKFSRWPYYISTAPGVAYAYLPDYRRNRKDIYAQAPSLEALAHKLGMPAANLLETAREYNGYADQGHDLAFGRTQVGSGLKVPPFYALGPAKGGVSITDGGLAVNSRMEVLDSMGNVIPGLFAAGSTGQGGVLLGAHGLHLMWAFTSGRIAGRNAALG